MKVTRQVAEYEIFLMLHPAFLSKNGCSVGQAVLNRGCTTKHFGLPDNINVKAYSKFLVALSGKEGSTFACSTGRNVWQGYPLM